MNYQKKSFLIFLLFLVGCNNGPAATGTGVRFKPVAPRRITMGPPQVILMDSAAEAVTADVLQRDFSRSNYIVEGKYVTTWRGFFQRVRWKAQGKNVAFSRSTWSKAPPDGTSGERFREGVVNVQRLRSLRTSSQSLSILGEPEVRKGPLANSVGGSGVALWQWRFYSGKKGTTSVTEVSIGMVMKTNKVAFVIVRVGDAAAL